MESKSVGILGSGAWGTGLAQALARGNHRIRMWAREADVADSVNNDHENKRYLPGYRLSENITVSNDIAEVASDKEFLIIASPSLYIADTVKKITALPGIADGSTCIAVLTKGFVPAADGPKLVLTTIENLLPGIYKGCTVYVSGPSHAEEVAIGKITGLVAACENPRNSIRVRELLRVPGILPYSSFDVVGVQICAAAVDSMSVEMALGNAARTASTLLDVTKESLVSTWPEREAEPEWKSSSSSPANMSGWPGICPSL